MPVFAQFRPVQQDTLTAAASGQVLQFNDNVASLSNSFEYLFQGTAPSTVTVTLVGCMGGGTCSSTLDSYTTVSNSIRTVTTSTSNWNGPYNNYQITVTWTGGDSTTKVKVNRLGVMARQGGGSGLPSGCTSPGTGQLTCTGAIIAASFTVTGPGAAFTQWTPSAFAAPGSSVLQFGSDISGNPIFAFNNNSPLNVPGLANDLCGTSLLPQVCGGHLTSEISFGSFGSLIVANAAGGTTVNLLAKLTATGATTALTTDTAIPMLGCVQSGAGASGSAHIAFIGPATCIADNTVTIGDVLGAGTTTGGRAKSIAAAGVTPTAGLTVVGSALTAAVAGGTFTAWMTPVSIVAASIPTLDQIGNLAASKTFANGAFGITVTSSNSPGVNFQTTSASSKSFRVSTNQATPTTNLFDVVDNGNVQTFQIDKNFHLDMLNKASVAPTITAGCGTSPSVTANSSDNFGQINVGTGGSATTCTITFHVAFTNAPFCVMTASAGTGTETATTTTGTLVVTTSVAWPASSLINWECENGGG